MADERYMIATGDNTLQIAIRNILDPSGFSFAGNSSDAISFTRLVRTYHPDFVLIGIRIKGFISGFESAIEVIDDEMLCAYILIGEDKSANINDMLEKSKFGLFCSRNSLRELLVNTVDIALLNQKRILRLEKKLKDITENYETRKVVEKAKWVLMKRYGCSEDDAYEKIRRKSMDTRLPIRMIAESVILSDRSMDKMQ